MTLVEAQELIEQGYDNALQLQDRPKCPNPRCEAFWDWHKDGFCLRNFGCSLTQEEVLANPRPDRTAQVLEDFASCAVDPFSDEALGERTPEAIAQDERQAADFAGFDPTYHAALVVIANEPGAGRFARAINLVAAIFQKPSTEVLRDACSL
jgi:hypothetical protein